MPTTCTIYCAVHASLALLANGRDLDKFRSWPNSAEFTSEAHLQLNWPSAFASHGCDFARRVKYEFISLALNCPGATC